MEHHRNTRPGRVPGLLCKTGRPLRAAGILPGHQRVHFLCLVLHGRSAGADGVGGIQFLLYAAMM